MFLYLLYFLQFYPYIFYLMKIYKLYEYIDFINNIYNVISRFYKNITYTKKNNNKNIDEIYEFIIETTPHESVTLDETKYLVYNEKDKNIKSNYF